VRGENLADTGDAVGVKGLTLSQAGVGVEGRAEGATGSGIGVYGVAEQAQGVGGWFETTGQGPALVVRGPADLETSGVATINSGSSSVVVSNGAAKTTSIVLCTLLADPGVPVLSHVIRSSGSFTIHLTANAATATPVAWLLLEN
jgi:hypothetical protein